jgi:hypothetical protein
MRVPTDEACNAVEVKTTQAKWRACEESAEFSSRGMYKEVLQELVRPGIFPARNWRVEKLNPRVRPTMNFRDSDQLIVEFFFSRRG